MNEIKLWNDADHKSLITTSHCDTVDTARCLMGGGGGNLAHGASKF